LDTISGWQIPGILHSWQEYLYWWKHCSFKGHILFKSFNWTKPLKWGLQVYVSWDSHMFYIVGFKLYNAQTTQEFTPCTSLHLWQSNQCKLWSYRLPCLHKFCTGYDLAVELVQICCHLSGSVQQHRKSLPGVIKRKIWWKNIR
jgi:hypothetical protein